eukprot:6182645-Pleurochrysis_carterae.AAC.4
MSRRGASRLQANRSASAHACDRRLPAAADARQTRGPSADCQNQRVLNHHVPLNSKDCSKPSSLHEKRVRSQLQSRGAMSACSESLAPDG